MIGQSTWELPSLGQAPEPDCPLLILPLICFLKGQNRLLRKTNFLWLILGD